MGSQLSSPNDQQWYDRSFSLDAPSGSQTVQFRMNYYYRYYSSNRIDDFILTTNLYPNQDIQVPTTLAESLAVLQNQLSVTSGVGTGGVQLESSSFTGDLHSVGDSITMSFENSVVSRNPNRPKTSHGICIYGNDIHVNTVNSAVLDHELDGIRLFTSSNILWDDFNTSISNNGSHGLMVTSEEFHWNSAESSLTNNGEGGFTVRGDAFLTGMEIEINGNEGHGISLGANSHLSLIGAKIQNNGSRGIEAQAGSLIEFDYVLLDDNGHRGIELAANGALSLGNCRLRGNGGKASKADLLCL